MKAKTEKTLADYVIIAVSPVLIMALVGSLVFFLAEVLYVGQYRGTLQWILFFFVFGAVLVSRMAIEFDAGRAAAFGLILGGVAWLGMVRYVVFPAGTFAYVYGWAINLGLVVVIWWSSHQLMRDCTIIDETKDASGTGLLEAAGLDDVPMTTNADDAPAADPATRPKRDMRREVGFEAWWWRYQRFREERERRPHVPGVWVVYFSLAALPLYGLGQSLIPPAEEERRRYAFWLMSVYVASGLGLMLTTSFLGLRRYLRQKKVAMPLAMTGVWLTLGAALIAGFLVMGALLPRPAAEYALIELPWRAGSVERDASRFAKGGDETGKGEGHAGTESKDNEEGKGDSSRAGKDGKDKSASKGNGQTAGKDKGSAAKAGSKEKRQTEQGNKTDRKAAPDRQGQGESRPEASGPIAVPGWISNLAGILKWIVLAVFIFLIVVFLLRSLLVFLANFTGWAKSLLDFFRALWQGLLSVRGSGESAMEAAPTEAPAPPFHVFSDPFTTGQAERMSPSELVRYTFEAVQSWAAERDLPRQTGETPLEFAERLGEDTPKLADEVEQLAKYYVGLAYARRSLTDDCRDPLRRLWLMLATSVRPQMAAHSARG